MSTPDHPRARTAARTSSPASGTSTSPHSVGLPPLRSYVRELWRRREFAVELARTKLREQNFDTAFGQLWLVLNPLLMALVYFILVDILRASDSRNSEFFAHLVAGLFVFMFIQQRDDGRRAVGDQGRAADPQLGVPARAAAAVGRDHGVHALPAHDRHLHPDPHRLGAAGRPRTCCGACRSSRCFVLLACRPLDAGRRRAGLLPRPLELPPLRAADLALRLAGPLLRGRGAAPLQVDPRRQPARRPADRVERRAQRRPGAGGRGRCCSGLAWGVGMFVAAGLFFLSREREFAVRL